MYVRRWQNTYLTLNYNKNDDLSDKVENNLEIATDNLELINLKINKHKTSIILFEDNNLAAEVTINFNLHKWDQNY